MSDLTKFNTAIEAAMDQFIADSEVSYRKWVSAVMAELREMEQALEDNEALGDVLLAIIKAQGVRAEKAMDTLTKEYAL